MSVRGLVGFGPGTLAHLYNHAIEQNDLFATENDRRVFYELLLEELPRDQLAILAWCLIGNHFHLLLRILEDAVAMSVMMRDVQSRYARHHSRTTGRRGALHMGRFGRRLVHSDAYARLVVAYIHANRVKDGFWREPTTDPWSSHRAWLGLVADPLIDLSDRAVLFGDAAGYGAAFDALLPTWTRHDPATLLERTVLRTVSQLLVHHPALRRYERGLGAAALVAHAGYTQAQAAARVGLDPSNGARTVRTAREAGQALLRELEARLFAPDGVLLAASPGPAPRTTESGRLYLPGR
ncbi:MAG: hypothetical protein R3F59_03175 [Myxococcota bacterium]